MSDTKKTVARPNEQPPKPEPTDIEGSVPEKAVEGKNDCLRLLIGSAEETAHDWQVCPYATTLEGWSMALERWVVIQQRCKRWGCRYCGVRKTTHYARRVQDAEPNRLITLTVNPACWNSPRDAYDGTRRKLGDLNKRLRKELGEWEYFRVLEVTKKGWPHYHLVARCPYIPQARISNLWNELTGAPIVDVRKIRKSKEVYYYVMKYLAKQTYIEWTNRRCSWSASFFPKDEWTPPESLNIAELDWIEQGPVEYLRTHYSGRIIEQIGLDAWAILDRPQRGTEEARGAKGEQRGLAFTSAQGKKTTGNRRSLVRYDARETVPDHSRPGQWARFSRERQHRP